MRHSLFIPGGSTALKALCITATISSTSGFCSPQRTIAALTTLHESTLNSPTATSDTVTTKGMPDILSDYCHKSSPRLPYSPTGYSTWKWETHHNPTAQTNTIDATPQRTTHSINYLTLGPKSAPAIVLVHGFGASSYHWRHNLPVLARTHRVYALDLLGFGWSDKPIMDYDASVWRDQVVDFVREVVHGESGEKNVVIAGNSLGGYTAMYASADERIKEYVMGCVLLNSAGRFRDPEEVPKPDPNPIVESISRAIQRMVIGASFIYTKQPARIEQILRQVYPVNDENVDEELVASIQTPSLDPNAAEVFYRVITKNGRGPQAYVDDIIEMLSCPVLLCWGEKDPWIRSAAADKMQRLHREMHGEGSVEKGGKYMRRVSVDAGHCPHDESPEEVNAAILEFVGEVF